jgi:hypothetical protein
MLESDLPADFAPECPAPLKRDPVRDGAGGGATRLKQEHGAISRKGRRNARRLSRAWFGDHDDRAPTFKGGNDVGNVRIDWERGEHDRFVRLTPDITS